MTDPLQSIIADWTRLGAMFGGAPAPATPDLELLLLRTAEHAPEEPRLAIMAVTWLHAYGDLVARHRLRRLICTELAIEDGPTLGLLLETAQAGVRPAPFATLLRDLSPASEPGPLFGVERASPGLIERAKRRASAVSLKWGRWCEPLELKADALRPGRWMMMHNPALLARADFRGDLRASVLASLAHDPGAGSSEMHLARCAGGSRAQIRAALDNLELTGRVRRQRRLGAKGTSIELVGRIEPGGSAALAEPA